MNADALEAQKARTKNVREQARGRWLGILSHICPGMFDEAIQSLGTHVTCPFHGGKEDFRFIKVGRKGRGNTADEGVAMCSCGVYADGFAVLQRATGMRFSEVVKAVDEYLNGACAPAHTASALQRPAPVDDGNDPAKIMAKVNKLWDKGQALSLSSTPYYLARGISREALIGLQDIRQLDSLAYFHKDGDTLKRLGNFPAVLALMRSPTGEHVAVHRTWLARDRKAKANVPKAKKLTVSPGAAGAAIRLHSACGCEVLGLSEGVETALAARSLAIEGYWHDVRELPVWACYSERNIRNFEVPDELTSLKKIIIFADNDKNGVGLTAAAEFQLRAILDYPDLVVEIKLPPVIGDDWNDEMLKWRATRAKLMKAVSDTASGKTAGARLAA